MCRTVIRNKSRPFSLAETGQRSILYFQIRRKIIYIGITFYAAVGNNVSSFFDRCGSRFIRHIQFKRKGDSVFPVLKNPIRLILYIFIRSNIQIRSSHDKYLHSTTIYLFVFCRHSVIALSCKHKRTQKIQSKKAEVLRKNLGLI